MAFFSHALRADSALPRDSAPASRGLFSLLLAAILESRQRQAEREIARFIELNGGLLTDNIEFEIERRLSDTQGFR
jgi:hypothetical protein